MRSVAVVVVVCFISIISAHTLGLSLSDYQANVAVKKLDNAISVSASPAALQASGDWVTVTWSGVENPDKNDFIGVYSQTPVNLSITPTKYRLCSASPSHLSTGSGSLKFRLVNMRSATGFVLFRGGVHSPVAAAYSNLVTFANYNEVCTIHRFLFRFTDCVGVASAFVTNE